MKNTINIPFLLSLLFLTPSTMNLRPYYNPKNKIKKFETSGARPQFTFQNLPLIAVIQAVSHAVPNPKYNPSFDMVSDAAINQKSRLKNSKDIYVNYQFTLLELPKYHN